MAWVSELFYKESKSKKRKKMFLFSRCWCGGGGGGAEGRISEFYFTKNPNLNIFGRGWGV